MLLDNGLQIKGVLNSRDASCDEFDLHFQEAAVGGMILHSTWTFVLAFSILQLDENDLGSLWLDFGFASHPHSSSMVTTSRLSKSHTS